MSETEGRNPKRESPKSFVQRAIHEIAPLPDAFLDADVLVQETPSGVPFVRTPEERFEDLSGYPFDPHYAAIDGLRMHYVDEGPAGGEPILLLHGQPTWSYLYRKMIPPLAAAGHRVIALDLMGLGRSDKPVDQWFHTFERQVALVKRFIDRIGLQNITFFGQDWGGAFGLRIAGDEPERFARVVVSNTTLPIFVPSIFYVPDPVVIDPDAGPLAEELGRFRSEPFPVRFQAWINYALRAPEFMPSEIVGLVTGGRLSEEEKGGYDAPFPSFIYRAAPRTLPSMMAGITTENTPAWASLGRFGKPFLFLAGERDREFGNPEVQHGLTSHVPGAEGQPHERLDAGHFIQEEIGEVLAERIIRFMAANPT
jgi:pimeloyl-ACP methyl ester carboxylesterase